jgi:hypothetical protein
VSEFLVEAYQSRAVAIADLPRLEDLSAAADQLRGEGSDVRFIRAIAVPEDEICFYLYRSDSPAAVREAAKRAGLQVERITEALSRTGTPNGGRRPQRNRLEEAEQCD